jgi:diaminopimelate epimerase
VTTPVSKYHGARNDFLILDSRAHAVADLRAFARRWCDRHSGVGADGVLVVGASDRAPVAMRVINSDGSEAEMCGNGIRCVARYLDERGEGGSFDIDTIAGIIRTEVIERGEVYRIRVDLGEPEIVTIGVDEAIVRVGNLHLVLFRASIEDVMLLELGQAMQRDARFPEGINVHLVAIEDRQTLRLRHYERGAGLTMACGTGTAAAIVAAIARGEAASPVRARVPGGELTIEWDGSGHVFMTGPAERVFDAAL